MHCASSHCRTAIAAGSIREVLRVEVYDGNDETFVQSAQAVLAELEDRFWLRAEHFLPTRAIVHGWPSWRGHVIVQPT